MTSVEAHEAAGGEGRAMDVTVHNGIEKCPKQCANADIRVWKKLRYGVRKASIVGVETFVTCAHASVCKKLIEQQSEAKS